MRVIGIDPGSRICGYGIIEIGNGRTGQEYTYVASGRIELSPRDPFPKRVKETYDALVDIIKQYKPEQAAIERVFFAKSVKAALHLGHARGVSMLAATAEGIDIYEYTALEVKKALVGYGRAEKRQVQEMVRAILNLKRVLSPDSADALALSICHLNTLRFKSPDNGALQSAGAGRTRAKNSGPQTRFR
ncbi:MAG: crossover junction endodeoxyribonuclease RuvC [Thermodesulfovibrionales bacterium]